MTTTATTKRGRKKKERTDALDKAIKSYMQHIK